MNIKNSDTLIIIEKGGEIVIRREEDIISAIGEDELWRTVSRNFLKNAWHEEDKVWDSIARKDVNG